jgi:phosphoadenosine phosphosulfate reductase
MTSHERIEWALETFRREEILATSSFGADSAVFLHLLSEVDRSVRVAFIDTGFLFPETLRFRERLKERLRLNLVDFVAPPPQEPPPESAGPAFPEGGPVWCACRKVEAMARALEGVSCWISGLRRDQAQSRRDAPVLEIQQGGLHKLHPIVDWPQARVTAYLRRHRLPLHPLTGRGYTSIGCVPCTRPPIPGQGARSGRWPGMDRDECGIHTFRRLTSAAG